MKRTVAKAEILTERSERTFSESKCNSNKEPAEESAVDVSAVKKHNKWNLESERQSI